MCMVYNQAYKGSTYSVKYLGIVDGTMGILSRKMALVGPGEAAVPISPNVAPGLGISGTNDPKIIMEDPFALMKVFAPEPAAKPLSMPAPMPPVLGKKNYTQMLGRSRRTHIIDENTHLIEEAVQDGAKHPEHDVTHERFRNSHDSTPPPMRVHETDEMLSKYTTNINNVNQSTLTMTKMQYKSIE